MNETPDGEGLDAAEARFTSDPETAALRAEIRRHELLRVPQAARLLDVPADVVLRLIAERKLTPVMVDGVAHVTRGDVDQLRGIDPGPL